MLQGDTQTQEQFAEFLGSTRVFVGMVMGGKRKPSMDTAIQWAEKLQDETILDLLGYARQEEQFRKLTDVYDSIPPARRKEAIIEFEKLLQSLGWVRKD